MENLAASLVQGGSVSEGEVFLSSGYLKWKVKCMLHLFPPTNYLIKRHWEKVNSGYLRNSQRRALQQNGARVADKAVGVLRSLGLNPVMVGGNLLGIVREGGFLKHDDDLDIAFVQDDDRVWGQIEEKMTEAGFEKIRQFEFQGVITEQAFEMDGLGVDLIGFIESPAGGGLRSFFYGRYWDTFYPTTQDHSVKYFDIDPLDCVIEVPVDGYNLPIPRNAEDWLVVLYGNSWKTPDPEWETGSNWTTSDSFGKCTFFLR